MKDHMLRCQAEDLMKEGVETHEIEMGDSLHHIHAAQMAAFLENEHLSDVQLSVTNESGEATVLPAHKFVLAYRSPVLKTLVSGGFAESSQSTIELNVRNTEAFRAVLRYLYTDIAVLNEDIAVDCLMLANEYQLDRFKSQCEEFVVDGIDVENVAWLFGTGSSTSLPCVLSVC